MKKKYIIEALKVIIYILMYLGLSSVNSLFRIYVELSERNNHIK